MTPTLERPLPSLPQLSSCTLCPLHTVARSIGIGLHYLPFSLPPSPTTPILLIIGQNPGNNEDREGTPFIGKSGHILQLAYIRAHNLHLHASIYLTNICRCYHRDGDGPTNSHYRACRPHLLTDLSHLLDGRGPSSLTILTLGAPATTHTYALLGRPRVTLASALTHQGASLPCPPSNPSPTPSAPSSPIPASPKPRPANASKNSATSSKNTSTPSPKSLTTKMPMTNSTTTPSANLTLFASYHPAAVDRANNLIHAVSGHLTLLLNHLTATSPCPTTPSIVPPFLPPEPPRAHPV